MRIIAGDVGGTKTILQLVDVDGQRREVVERRRYESGLYPRFESMLLEFRERHPAPIDCGCFAVAGPVEGDFASITNLPWVIDAKRLASDFSIGRVLLINDFYAAAAGVPLLRPEDLVSLQPGVRDRSSPIAILGAGTGLGEASLVPMNNVWRVIPSEGGHADFAPVTPLQRELLAWLERRYGHVSYERLLSGPGLVNIFTFLRDRSRDAADRTGDGADLPETIAALAAAGDPLAIAAFDLFIDIYGAEAGNLALKLLPRGGVFIVGGMAAKNLPRFTDGRFVRAFAAKGRFEPFMAQFPVDVIRNTNVGLEGALAVALQAASE